MCYCSTKTSTTQIFTKFLQQPFHSGQVHVCAVCLITFYLKPFHSAHKSSTILISPTWINMMDIPCTIYVNKLDIYKILTQTSVRWPPGRQRLHWQFHVDIPKGKKKNIKGIQISLPLVYFSVPSSLASMKVRSGCFILQKGLPWHWRAINLQNLEKSLLCPTCVN